MKTSAAMCTYNGEKFIKTQIESILNQSLPIDEIVICDDGSNDKTIEIIMQFQLEYPNKISLHKNPINLRSNKNFEKAISLCNGDYIFLSDQDDLWKKNKVEKTIEYFTKNESAEAVFSNAELINDNNKKITKNSLWDSIGFMENQLSKPIDLYHHIKFKSNVLTGATLCIKREIKSLILPIPDIPKFYHDEWIAIIIASRKKLEYITDELISYRLHTGQQIGARGNLTKNRLKNHLTMGNHILGHTTPKKYGDYARLARIYYRNYLKFKKVADKIKDDSSVNFKEIAETNLDLFKKYNKSLKKTNPVFYFFRTLTDKIRGKRQLN
ncbi:glycosyltransferase family 2 protein [Flavobacterium granuli]|uniref:Glycosyltransferase involved in cell wall biosynthesis n=1 Tax=Flavobacterium granuli TaxID=280093 RepID=A0ABU1S5A1_9FLAO|nr:glycosyltransferase family 2 protein [Flavobacterium granuli]MDR6846087.1 glycosyltransferase involved in cell wall biosynthesis [Flavobacterium granuli]